MEEVTEFELMQAVWDCSRYVEGLPTREETSAIKAVSCQLMMRWIDQQDLSREEKFKLLDEVTKPGPIDKAALKAFRKRSSCK